MTRKACMWLLACGALYAVACGDGDAVTYRPSVGSWVGKDERWDYGSDTTLEKCREQAADWYSEVSAESPGRAIGWVCLVIKNGSIAGKVK
jgi:hypothetical protein